MEGHIVHRLYDGRGQQEPEPHKPTAAGPHTRRTRARENEREPKQRGSAATEYSMIPYVCNKGLNCCRLA